MEQKKGKPMKPGEALSWLQSHPVTMRGLKSSSPALYKSVMAIAAGYAAGQTDIENLRAELSMLREDLLSYMLPVLEAEACFHASTGCAITRDNLEDLCARIRTALKGGAQP